MVSGLRQSNAWSPRMTCKLEYCRKVQELNLDQSNFLANQQQVIGFAVPVTSPSILCKNVRLKTILMSQTSMF